MVRKKRTKKHIINEFWRHGGFANVFRWSIYDVRNLIIYILTWQVRNHEESIRFHRGEFTPSIHLIIRN